MFIWEAVIPISSLLYNIPSYEYITIHFTIDEHLPLFPLSWILQKPLLGTFLNLSFVYVQPFYSSRYLRMQRVIKYMHI